MRFFNFAFKQSEKGFGRVFLFSLLLAFITTVSVLVAFARELSYMNSNEFLDEYESTYNCRIENYQLMCNEDLYDFGTVKIDLNYTGDTVELGYDTILTRTGILTNNSQGKIPYESLFTTFEISQSSLTIEDGLDLLNDTVPLIYTLIIIFGFIGLMIAYPIGNLLLALVMMLIINGVLKVKFDYKQIYKLTIVTTIPYVLFNAICRMIFGNTLSSLVPLPILQVIIDYGFIYLFTYLAVKEGLKNKPVDNVLEGTVVEENPTERNFI